MNRFLVIPALALCAGCASEPQPAPAPEPPVVKEYTPPISESRESTYTPPKAAPEAVTGRATRKQPEKLDCETPLGPIRHGGTATGYLAAKVPAGQICVSDVLTCEDGTWKGNAIHKDCVVEKEK